MPKESILTAVVSRFARIPFALQRKRPFTPPKKALILKPCCVSQVLLTTPLLAALSETYPDARFDWAISDWARPAIIGNPRLTELISAGEGGMSEASWRETFALARRLRQEEYDTCFIPSRSSLLALIAWMARIPQRIGLQVDGRGFAHTLPIAPPEGIVHETAVYFSLAAAANASDEAIAAATMEFYPPDSARTAVTKRLVDDLDWLGDAPLIIVHPGGGINPVRTDKRKQWPVERFVLLVSGLARAHEARILLIGDHADKPIADKIAALVSVPIANWAGQLSLGEIGALSEVADLYIGHDTGPTHVATAVGCPTLAIFGPSNPAISGPHFVNQPHRALWVDATGRIPFTWDDGVSVKDALRAAADLMRESEERRSETAVYS